MRINYLILTLLITIGFTFSSCIKDEAQTMESDIISATFEGASDMLRTEPVFTTNTITFRLNKSIVDFNFAPIFELSEGATIQPLSGTTLDFTKPQYYTVTSQDGQWKKRYEVTFVIDEFITNYGFEFAKTIVAEEPYGIYHEFFEYTPEGNTKVDWTSGNFGFNILAETLADAAGVELTPSFYPTSQVENGYKGKGAKLKTSSTGELGGMFGSPIAAGNLYLGVFNLTFPAIESTKFGIPYQEETLPQAVTGYFKYKKGDKFEVHSVTGSNLKEDTWDVYAIVFEKYTEADRKVVEEAKRTGQPIPKKIMSYLPGTHAFKDERMVAVARIKPEDRIETDEWTKFTIPFKTLDGKEFKPEEKEYMFTIVFSASLEGDLFNGAVGSTLYVDEVELVYDAE